MATTTGEIDLDSYTQLPIQMDAASKLLSVPNPTSNSTSTTDTSSLQETLDTINNLHANLKTLDTANSIPPAPAAGNVTTQKRTAHITKLRETASTAYRKSQFAESVRLYTFAIDGAAGRPPWEPVGLIREELAGLYRDRAQAYMGTRAWVEGWKDCEASVECKKPQGEKGKVWWRGGRCLMEMGRYADAVRWLEKGLDCENGFQGEHGREMRTLLEEARKKTDQVPGL